MAYNHGPYGSQGPPFFTGDMSQCGVYNQDEILTIGSSLRHINTVVPGLAMNDWSGPDQLVLRVREGKYLRNAELRLICKAAGLRSTGVKFELQTRLIDRRALTCLSSSTPETTKLTPTSQTSQPSINPATNNDIVDLRP
jgi:hypothetical protein